MEIQELTGGRGISLMGTLGDPELAADYVQHELRVAGTAHSFRSETPSFPPDGRLELHPHDTAEYATRLVVRRPSSPERCSGTVVLEWLNVSSGTDAAPAYGFLGPEIFRRGHVWVGMSAQSAGIDTAPALVEIDTFGPEMRGLRQRDPDRYASLHHPGDAYAYDMFTQVARAVRDVAGGPVAGLPVRRVLAVGESQSAYTLTTYADGVQPLERAVDGFLIHSRGGPAAPLDGPAGRIDLEAGRGDGPVRIRDDLDTPVLVVQTETDLLGHLNYLPARQPDTERFRLWEIAGTAHADRSLIGDFESVLGCPEPVNRGQQRFVVRAALRHLVAWCDGGAPPPAAERLGVTSEPPSPPRFVVDEVGNVVGGVRTPCVDAAVEVLSGLAAPGANRACRLFGRTLPVSDDVLRGRYPTAAAYLDRYAAATDAAIAAGFVLDDDRTDVLADARAERITW